MADFSVRSTNIDPIPNAVTAKDTPVDESLATFVGAMNTAAEGAVESWSAHRGVQLYKDLEQEFRQNLGYTADPLGNEYSVEQPLTAEEAILTAKVDRLDQVAKTVGRASRAELMLEAQVREAQARDPFLADRYERIKNRLRGEYSQTINILNQYDQKMDEAAKEADKRLLARQKNLASVLQYAKINPVDGTGKPISPYSIYDEETLAFWESQAFYAGRLRQDVDDAYKASAEGRAVAGEQREQGRYGMATTEFGQRQYEYRRDMAQRNAINNAEQMAIGAAEREVQKAIAEGGRENPAAALARLNEGYDRARQTYDQFLRSQTTSDGQPFLFDADKVAASRQRMEQYYTDRLSLFNGPTSVVQQNELMIAHAKSQFGLEGLESAPYYARIRVQLGDAVLSSQAVSSALSIPDVVRNTGANVINKEFETMLTPKQEGESKLQAIVNVTEGKPVDPRFSPSALIFATKTVRAANVSGFTPQNPEAYVNYLGFAAEQYDTNSMRDRVNIYNDLFSGDYAKQLSAQPNPRVQAGATAALYKVLVGQADIVNRIYAPVIGSVKWDANKGLFVGDGTMQSENAATEVNKVVGHVDQLKQFNPNIPSPQDVATSVFGLSMPELNPEKPQ